MSPGFKDTPKQALISDKIRDSSLPIQNIGAILVYDVSGRLPPRINYYDSACLRHKTS